MNRLDMVTDVVAIVALVVVAVEAGADPTTVVVGIAGLGGYRMRQSGGLGKD